MLAALSLAVALIAPSVGHASGDAALAITGVADSGPSSFHFLGSVTGVIEGMYSGGRFVIEARNNQIAAQVTITTQICQRGTSVGETGSGSYIIQGLHTGFASAYITGTIKWTRTSIVVLQVTFAKPAVHFSNGATTSLSGGTGVGFWRTSTLTPACTNNNFASVILAVELA